MIRMGLTPKNKGLVSLLLTFFKTTMLPSSLFITFLLEYFLTPAEDLLTNILAFNQFVRTKLDIDDKKIALVSWLVLVWKF